MREPRGKIEYGVGEVQDAFRLWGDGAIDEDLDRRADMVRAFCLQPLQTRQVLALVAAGYTGEEIAFAVLNKTNGKMAGSRLVARAFNDLRMGMNGC